MINFKDTPWAKFIPLIPGMILLLLSCDDRVPSEVTNDNYIITVSTSSIANGMLVGEDVVGPTASTRVTATVTDLDGKPVKDVLISFSADINGVPYGSFDLSSDRTNDDGIISVIYSDGEGNGAVDDATTEVYEGVKVVARYNETVFGTAKFDVYGAIDDVWPYKMFLSSDVYEIGLDNGATKALITTRLLNKLNRALPNVLVHFTATKGFIETEATTDDNGSIALEFTDLGTQDDIGVANITASFEHPGAGASILDSVQITITTQFSLTLESFPVAVDGSGNIIVVGEDVSGDNANTMIVATVRDTANNPVTGAYISFAARVSGVDVGTITVANPNTNSAGQVIAFFDDGGNVYRDTPGTPNYEGVILSANFGEDVNATTKFNVFDENEVWPYSLLVNTDTDVIYVDNGATQATITVRLLNALGLPVQNVEVAFSANHGYINATGLTDSAGVDTVFFSDLGDPDDIGLTDIEASFVHPGYSQSVSSAVQVIIEDNSFGTCAYMEIPPSAPGHIVVQDGGGNESTSIRAEVYDDQGNLIDYPVPVNFILQPAPAGALLNETGAAVTVYTVNGVASVSINSGTEPGPVRVVVTVDCDEDGSTDLTSIAVPVIISSGAPFYIEPEYNPGSTEPIGGGFYQTEAGALVYDRWYNPVEDSTYVYWSIDPIPPDTVINAEIDGISFTGNENSEGNSYSGVCYTFIRYATDAIGDFGRITATTYGANGDTISEQINPVGEDAVMFFVPGEVNITTNIQYWDFTLPFPTTQVSVLVTARVIDFYGNEVADVPISFGGIGVGAWQEVGYESYVDIGVNGLGAGDGCFTWRDYGFDNLPGTLDIGEGNDDHDGWDLDGDGIADSSEVSEPWDDFGLDGVPGTLDIGENDGQWNGYHMIDCGPLVKTDQDGIARITAVFSRGLCILQNQDDSVNPPVCTYEDFQASVFGTLLIPEITTSDPVEIQLVRTPDNCN